MSTITIRNRTGFEIDVTAEVCGDWAYHRDFDFPQRWTITHVPSGYKAVTWTSLRSVKRAMKALASLPSFTVPKRPKRAKRYQAVLAELASRLAEAENPA